VRPVAAGGIFAGSYAALAIGKVPGLAIDRAGIALVGACLMVVAGAIPLEEAYRAIDLNTITLLLGMMIVVANLRLSGFFALANAWIAVRAHRPITLLAAIVFLTGLLSAFLVNDAICLVLTPLVAELTIGLKRDPVPYLLGVAMAANAGSVATITGNPQNMMIGALSQIPYGAFTLSLAPIALAGLVVTVLLLAVVYRREFLTSDRLEPRPPRRRVNRVLVIRSLLACLAVIALFFAGQPPAKAAIVVGAVLLLTRRVRTSRIHAELDWSLLLMFAGLFIIVAGAERMLLTRDMVEAVGRMHLDQAPVLAGVTAVLSNLVSNVPAVLLLKPFVVVAGEPAQAWKVIAMASTLAGNLTLLASVANLIVAEKAARSGVEIGFVAHARVGVPVTLLSLTAGVWWLAG
jgi:Na+/H+ antiporter NhaD/arsenite permease-like protein